MTSFWLFLTTYPPRWHFHPYERWQKVNIFGLPTPSSCKHSLWTTPKVSFLNWELKNSNLNRRNLAGIFLWHNIQIIFCKWVYIELYRKRRSWWLSKQLKLIFFSFFVYDRPHQVVDHEGFFYNHYMIYIFEKYCQISMLNYLN